MFKILKLGPYAPIIKLGKVNRSAPIMLEENDRKGYKIILKQTQGYEIDLLDYSLFREGNRVTAIDGFFNGDNSFHIRRIYNSCKNKKRSYLDLIRVFKKLEEDIIGRGIESLTSSSVERHVPILERRYGFNRKPDSKKYWIEYFHPWRIIGMEKKLG